MRTRIATISLLASLALAATALAGSNLGFGLDVLVDGAPRIEYFHDGTRYVEATRGASYELRLTNPTPYRVAVALSVDGLNTLDARHTDARSAAKWVLGPYDSMVISGWQVSDETSRAFFFTGERRSYGAALGRTENLGVIEAVFFRERRPVQSQRRWNPSGLERGQAAEEAAPPAKAQKSDGLSDDYAATGMGRRQRQEISTVEMDLEPDPAASVRLRYEFAPQLVKMGILPAPRVSPIERRERARGFSNYCPEPR